MECPHLSNHRILSQLPRKLPLSCILCSFESSLWLCVFCGHIGCGRYHKGHSLAHFTKMSSHSVAMDVETTALYCYMCDDYVVNEDANISSLRNTLARYKESLTPKNSPKENGVPAKIKKYSGISRPSRQHSASSNKLPGLKNLGNTCFMNAVVQSLSNIVHFSSYLNQLPSIDATNFVFRRHQSTGQSLSPPASSNGNSGVNGGADCGRLPIPPSDIYLPETRLRRKRDRDRLQSSGSSSEEDSLVVEELRKILLSLTDSNQKTISPDALFAAIWRVVPSFRGHQQQDAHEFMRFLLDRLHTELSHLQPNSKQSISVSSPFSSSDFVLSSSSDVSLFGRLTIVAAIFGGLLQSDVACHMCNNVSIKRDPFLDLSLDIPIPKDKLLEANSLTCRLMDCLTSFTEVEELGDSEHFYCPMCRKHQPSTKKFTIKRLPNVLCIHLKRFWWNGTNRVKLDTYVDFPVRCLDMSRYVLTEQRCTRLSAVNNDCHYDLAAVIVHHGSGTGSGHFTTFALHEGAWLHFNDSTVRPATLADVQAAKAYILFYVRQSVRIPPSLHLSTACSPKENNNSSTAPSSVDSKMNGRRRRGTPMTPTSNRLRTRKTQANTSPSDSASTTSTSTGRGGSHRQYRHSL